MRKRNNETKHLDQDLNCDTVIKTKTIWGPQKLPVGLPGSLKHRLLGLIIQMYIVKVKRAGLELQPEYTQGQFKIPVTSAYAKNPLEIFYYPCAGIGDCQ